MKISVQTPATVANLGCGFDCFGLALPLYNIVTIEETIMPGSGIEINILDKNENLEAENIPTDKNNIVYKAIELLYNYIGQTPAELKINIADKQICFCAEVPPPDIFENILKLNDNPRFNQF